MSFQNTLLRFKSRYTRMHDCILFKSNTENVIPSNPNNVAWNLSSWNLTNEELQILSYGLNDSLAAHLSSDDALPSIESVWYQLTRKNFLKDNCHYINRIKNCQQAFICSLIDLDNWKVFKYKKQLPVTK